MDEIKEYTYKWYEFGCKDASYLKVKADYTSLSFSEKFLYNFHLAMCKYCRRFVRQMNKIDTLTRLSKGESEFTISSQKKLIINQAITDKLTKK